MIRPLLNQQGRRLICSDPNALAEKEELSIELTYRTEGDYQIPNLTLATEKAIPLGKYARLRKRHLKQHRRILYTNLLTTCTLNRHLAEIDQTANERMELLSAQMVRQQGIMETLKATDQMRWVGLMNNIKQAAEEVVLSELIYA